MYSTVNMNFLYDSKLAFKVSNIWTGIKMKSGIRIHFKTYLIRFTPLLKLVCCLYTLHDNESLINVSFPANNRWLSLFIFVKYSE